VGRADWFPGRRVCKTDLSAGQKPDGRSQEIAVNMLKHIYQALIQLGKQACLLPKTIANAAKLRQEQTVRAEHEVERLDRIRNPWKYRGK